MAYVGTHLCGVCRHTFVWRMWAKIRVAYVGKIHVAYVGKIHVAYVGKILCGVCRQNHVAYVGKLLCGVCRQYSCGIGR